MTTRDSRLFFMFIVAVALMASPSAVAAMPDLVFSCRPDNDLYRVLAAGGAKYPRYDNPRAAVKAAASGAGVLVLADGYPEKQTTVDVSVVGGHYEVEPVCHGAIHAACGVAHDLADDSGKVAAGHGDSRTGMDTDGASDVRPQRRAAGRRGGPGPAALGRVGRQKPRGVPKPAGRSPGLRVLWRCGT